MQILSLQSSGVLLFFVLFDVDNLSLSYLVMKKITNYFLLVYLFGIQFVLYGLRRPDALFVQMGIVNLLVFILGGMLVLHLAHRLSSEAIKDALRHFSTGIGWFVERYVFIFSIFALIVASIVDFFVDVMPCIFVILAGLFLYTLIIARQSIWQKTIHFGKRLFMPKDVLFWISIMVALSIWHLFPSWDVWHRLGIATFSGILFYYVTIKLSDAIGSYSFMKLTTAKLYAFVLVVAVIASLFSFRFAFVSQAFVGLESVVSHGIEAAKWLFVSQEDKSVMSGELVTNEELLVISTWTVLMQTGDTETGSVEPIVIRTINFADALSYLIDTYDVPVSSQKAVKFRYVSYTNALYPIFAAAYSKKLIGASTNPVSLVRCDVYQVMKGILAGWEVTAKGNVLDTYWNYASANNLLNGCVSKGDTVMTNNL